MGEPEEQQSAPSFWQRFKKKVISAAISWVVGKVTAVVKWACRNGWWFGFVLLAIGIFLAYIKWYVTGIIVFVVGLAIIACWIFS